MKNEIVLTCKDVHLVNQVEVRNWDKPVLNHSHVFFELFYILRGTVLHSLNNGEKTPMKAGDYMLVDIGSCHSMDFNDGEAVNVAFLPTVIINQTPMCTSFFQLLSYRDFSVINTSHTPFPVNTILHDDNGQLLSQIELIRESTVLQSAGDDLVSGYILKHQLISLILYIAKKYCSFDKESSVSPIVQKTLKILSTHYNEPNPLNIAALETSYSHSTLSVAFKNEMGISPTEYRKQMQ